MSIRDTCRMLNGSCALAFRYRVTL